MDEKFLHGSMVVVVEYNPHSLFHRFHGQKGVVMLNNGKEASVMLETGINIQVPLMNLDTCMYEPN